LPDPGVAVESMIWRSVMGGPIGSLLGWRRRRDTPTAAVAVQPGPQTEDLRQRARALADAIDEAMEQGHWSRAERLARSAPRLARHSARLTERLARLRLAQGDPETALNLIDGAPRKLDSTRLMRAACLIQLGRKDEAHADLLCWSRRSTAPLDARLLLALLEWEAGDHHAAGMVLQRNLRHLEDPRTVELKLLLAVARHRDDQAQEWADRLCRCTFLGSRATHRDLMLYSLGIPPQQAQQERTKEQIEALAIELVSHEHLLPSLIAALEIERHTQSARFVYDGLIEGLDELSDRTQGFAFLARLALLCEDRAAARDWTTRGLDENPMSASLRLLLDRLDERAPDVLATIGNEAPSTQEHAA
jgi:hypothetical protein